jgi:transketolase
MQASVLLAAEGVAVRVVSMPSTSVFDRQPRDWQDAVLPPGVPRVAIEAGHADFWRKYVGLDEHGGAVVGLSRFGESAPAPALFEHFAITADRVVSAARECVARGR